MSDPRPIRLTLLAKRLHLPETQVREVVYATGRHWGMDRVAVFGKGGLTVTPAGVVAIRQHFGIGDLPQLRGQQSACSHTTPKERAA